MPGPKVKVVDWVVWWTSAWGGLEFEPVRRTPPYLAAVGAVAAGAAAPGAAGAAVGAVLAPLGAGAGLVAQPAASRPAVALPARPPRRTRRRVMARRRNW